MKTMTAGFFNRNCARVIDGVHARRETVVITKSGKPVAKLAPVSIKTDEIFDFLAGKGAVVGDVVSPAFGAKGRKKGGMAARRRVSA